MHTRLENGQHPPTVYAGATPWREPEPLTAAVGATLRSLAMLCALLAQFFAPAFGREGTDPGIRIGTETRVARTWPWTRMLSDPSGSMTLQDALARRADFEAPRAPEENLGVRPDAVWLSVSLKLDRGAPHDWILAIDYPSLDEIDAYLLTGGTVAAHTRMGDSIAFDRRPLPSRAHAMNLALLPGTQQELMLRIRTSGTMIVPIQIWRPDQYLRAEASVQALQGVLAGAALCLMTFSLVTFTILRDRIFLFYAVNILGTTLFFLAYYGVAAQYLWPGSAWLAGNVAPIAVLVAIFGASHFVVRSLDLHATHRRLARATDAVGWTALAACAAFLAGIADYRLAHAVGTVLGPLPMLLVLPVALRRVVAGNRPATYLVTGWVLLLVGIVFMVGLLRGWMPVNTWTGHAFQVGNFCEMVCWMFVLITRIERIRRRAETARREHDNLRALARTDALTGLLNRRGLDVALAAVLGRAERGRCNAVFAMDLDGFKQINDRFGHAAGDAVLTQVGEALRQCIRTSDIVARPGGDEFVVVASNLRDPRDAQELGAKLLDAVSRRFSAAGRDVHVAATIGYALHPIDGDDGVALLARADEAMYLGKNAGKRRIERWLRLDAEPGAAG